MKGRLGDLTPGSIKVVKEKTPLLVAGSFLAFQPAPLSRIVLAFRILKIDRMVTAFIDLPPLVARGE
jgi:hypothetical protein